MLRARAKTLPELLCFTPCLHSQQPGARISADALMRWVRRNLEGAGLLMISSILSRRPIPDTRLSGAEYKRREKDHHLQPGDCSLRLLRYADDQYSESAFRNRALWLLSRICSGSHHHGCCGQEYLSGLAVEGHRLSALLRLNRIERNKLTRRLLLNHRDRPVSVRDECERIFLIPSSGIGAGACCKAGDLLAGRAINDQRRLVVAGNNNAVVLRVNGETRGRFNAIQRNVALHF